MITEHGIKGIVYCSSAKLPRPVLGNSPPDLYPARRHTEGSLRISSALTIEAYLAV